MIPRFHGREPELLDFIDFVENETLLANDPLSSQEALREYNEWQEKGPRRKLKFYVSNAAELAKNERDVSSRNNCPVCEGRLDLDNCSRFNDLKMKEQSKTLRKTKLCCDCYLPMTCEHNVKSCKK